MYEVGTINKNQTDWRFANSKAAARWRRWFKRNAPVTVKMQVINYGFTVSELRAALHLQDNAASSK